MEKKVDAGHFRAVPPGWINRRKGLSLRHLREGWQEIPVGKCRRSRVRQEQASLVSADPKALKRQEFPSFPSCPLQEILGHDNLNNKLSESTGDTSPSSVQVSRAQSIDPKGMAVTIAWALFLAPRLGMTFLLGSGKGWCMKNSSWGPEFRQGSAWRWIWRQIRSCPFEFGSPEKAPSLSCRSLEKDEPGSQGVGGYS
jgi:hypothetical protein